MMIVLRDRYGVALVLGALAVIRFAGCSSSSSPVTVSATPSPGPTATSISGTLIFAQGTQTLPVIAGGYSDTIVFSSAPAPPDVTATYTWSVNAPSAVPSPGASCSPSYASGTPLVYLWFSPASGVSYSPSPNQTFTLPASISTSGHTFYTAFDDVSSPTHPCLSGPGTVNGQIVTFTGAASGESLVGGATYVSVLLEY
jgi:hypothetical protein